MGRVRRTRYTSIPYAIIIIIFIILQNYIWLVQDLETLDWKKDKNGVKTVKRILTFAVLRFLREVNFIITSKLIENIIIFILFQLPT